MNSRFLLFPTILLILSLAACNRMIDTRPVPADENPVISLADAGRTQILRRIGSTADISLRLGDNENLKLLRITETVFDQDSVLLVSDVIKQDITFGQEGLFIYTYNYSVTNNVAGVNLGDYYRIRLTFYAIDSKGVDASAVVDIDILPDPLGPPAFNLRSYSDVILNHPNNLADPKATFYFIGRSYPTNVRNKDIEIVDNRPGPFTGKSFISPANTAGGYDSLVFVKTSLDKLNYDDCDHRIIEQAYMAAEKYYGKLSLADLQVDDLIIVRLTQEFTNFDKHYAIMRIKEFVTQGAPAAQIIRFDYKVSD
ncbi:MAG: hypothetical protein R3B47_07300 [Bacteroidia bacterium]